MRIWLAIRCLFTVLFNASTAEKVKQVLDGVPPKVKAETPIPAEQKAIPSLKSVVRDAGRNEAITLLAALQREARFLDIVQEPLDSYTDDQIGAAAREVLKNCAALLDRLFAPQPALSQEEGSEVEIPAGYDPMRFRIVGNVSGEPPFHGKLVHHGWTATRCELPVWSGGPTSANVVAPIEVEVP